MIQSTCAKPIGIPQRIVVLCFLAVLVGYTDRVNISVASVAMAETLHWSQSTKGAVLSAFFVGYIVSLLPSGWLATRFGGRRILPIAVSAWSLCTLVTPLAAATSMNALVAARICLGLAEGALFPSCYDMLGKWVEAPARTRAVTMLMSGIPIGQVSGLMTSGWILAHYEWPAVFYVFGVLGFVWLSVWMLGMAYVRNDRTIAITLTDTSIASADGGVPQDTGTLLMPWRQMLARHSVWAVVVALFCGNWGLYFLLSWLPSYFRGAQGLSISNAGFFSTAPWLSAFALSNVAALISDAAIARGVCVTVVRKTVLCTGFVGSAAFLLMARDVTSAITALGLLCGATGGLGIAWSAYTANYLDLAPRHAAVLSAFGNTLATIPGIVGVAITGWIVDRTGTYSSAFAMSAAVSGVGAAFYCAFGSGKPLLMRDTDRSPFIVEKKP
jgi:MFS transporter, ACS family, solute carrier family 17 (sodium-dependent inorganic phosphate cotransporter), other